MKINYLISFLFLCFNLGAQTTSHPFWTPEADVYDVEIDTVSNTLYVGGNFTKFVPPSETNSALVNIQSGRPDYSFANPNDYVFCSVSDGNGGFFIGGSFTQVGDSVRKVLAHIDANGNVTSWNPLMEGGTNVKVHSMALVGDSLFIGGDFGQIAGQTRSCFAVLSATNGSLYNWSPGFSGTVFSIVAKNHALYVGGAFTHSDGSNIYNNLVRFNLPSGTASIWQPDITGHISDIEVIDSTVYIIGPIFTVNGQTRSGFASIYEMRDSFGNIVNDSLGDLTIATNGGHILDLLIKGDTLFVGGQFNIINSQSRNNIAALNRFDGIPYSLDIEVDGDVNAMTIKDSSIYFGGQFMMVDGVERQSLAAYNLFNAQLTSWNPSLVSGTVHAIEIVDSVAYISGGFYSIGTKYRKHIASIDHSTGILTDWNPQLNGQVNAVHLTADKILIGGEFTTVNGITRNHFAAFDRSNGSLLSWNPSINGSVYSIKSIDSMIYVGGAFTQVNGTSYGNLFAANGNTGIIQSWNPQLNDTVLAVYVSGSNLYAGGNFTSAGGSSRTRIARFNLTSLSLDSWNPEFNSRVRAISQNGNEILVGGDFTAVNSTNRNYFASIQVASGYLNTLDVNPNDYVRAIESLGTKSYIGGRFTTIGGQQRNFVAEIDLFNNVISPWNLNPTGPYGPTSDLCIYDSVLVVAGADYGPQGGGGHIYEVPNFSNFTPLPFTVNVFTHPSFYNTCSGSAMISVTGAPGFTLIADNEAPIYSNGSITIDSLCAGIHQLKVYDFYNDSIIQFFVIGQDSGVFVLDTLSNSSLYSLFGLTIENCNIDYQTIDTMFIVSGTAVGNQLNLVWTVVDALGSHTDSCLYDLYLGPGLYCIQIGFYCPNKSQNDFYSYTQLVNIIEGSGTASILNQVQLSNFEIYPNPTNDQVNVNFTGSEAELTVYDLQGKVVFRSRIQNKGIVSLQNFERGVYLFEVISEGNRTVKRVVKN